MTVVTQKLLPSAKIVAKKKTIPVSALKPVEIENSTVLEDWDGDLSKLEGSIKYLEKLFADIDKDKS